MESESICLVSDTAAPASRPDIKTFDLDPSLRGVRAARSCNCIELTQSLPCEDSDATERQCNLHFLKRQKIGTAGERLRSLSAGQLCQPSRLSAMSSIVLFDMSVGTIADPFRTVPACDAEVGDNPVPGCWCNCYIRRV